MKELSMEDKKLLLKDLSARLPYGTNIKCPLDDEPYTLLSINWNKEIVVIGFMMDGMLVTSKQKLANVRPCLRPMSSMTEEESAELSNIISEWFDKELFYLTEEPFLEYALQKINYSINPQLFDWLNSHYFDYRTDDEGKTMIEKGLALEAPKGMYNIKNK